MKILVFGQAKSYADELELGRLIKKIERQLGPVERINPESRDGAGKMEAYDIMATPAVVLTGDHGAPVMSWQHSFPRYDDIAAYYQVT